MNLYIYIYNILRNGTHTSIYMIITKYIVHFIFRYIPLVLVTINSAVSLSNIRVANSIYEHI